MFFLADNAISIGMGTLNLVVSAGLTIVLYRIGRTVSSRDRAEDRSEKTLELVKAENSARIKTLEENLHATTTKLIDERFREISHSVANSASALKMTMDEIRQRLQDGDEAMDGLMSVDHQLELKVAAKFEVMKDWIRDASASKPDLKEHEKHVAAKFDRLDEKLAEMITSVAVLADRMSGREAGQRLV